MAMSQQSIDGFSKGVLSQRIVYVDSYTSFPIPDVDVIYSQFRQTEVKRVPVIRIYGATTHGQKACAHVHGVFPYLYIEQDESVFNMEERLAWDLDREISSSLLEFNHKQSEHVYKIIPVTGRSFYGYKFKEQTFLQIYFYSPIALTKAIGLLQSGKILGQKFQPYEAHIPYILQFFLDFKLHGMNFIHFSNVKFRGQCESNTNEGMEYLDVIEPWKRIDLTKLDRNNFLSSKVTKRSRCELEFDVSAQDIIQLQSAAGKNPGIEAIWLDEKERRRQNGLEDWAEVTIPVSQNRPNESFLFKRENELFGILESKLTTHLASVSVLNNGNGTAKTPPRPQPSAFYPSFRLTPSSQVLIEDVARINADSPVVSQSLDWNEEDDEMVLLLEDMARNRFEDDSDTGIEEDSIMSSQIIADFQNDPFLENAEVEAGGQREEQNNTTIIEEDENWGNDFFSTSVVQLLNEFENEAIGAEAKARDYKLNQVDGQFDSSDYDDDNEIFIPKKFIPVTKHYAGLPVTGGHRHGRTTRKMKSAEDVLHKPTSSFLRFASASSLPPASSSGISPSRTRLRPPTPPSPPIISSSSSDSDTDDVVCKKPKFILASATSIPELEKSPILSNVGGPDKTICTQKPNSPHLISSIIESDDSDETSYNPSEPGTPNPKPEGSDQFFETSDGEIAVTNIQSVEELQAASDIPSYDSVATSPEIEDVEEPRSSQVSQDGIDSGIRSFYVYPGEDYSQLIDDNDSVDDEEESERLNVNICPSHSVKDNGKNETSGQQLSQAESIQSFYGYSDTEDVETGTNFPVLTPENQNSSLQHVSMRQQLDSGSHQEESSPSVSCFVKKAAKTKVKLTKEHEPLMVRDDVFCSSVFSKVNQLRNPPAAHNVSRGLDRDHGRPGSLLPKRFPENDVNGYIVGRNECGRKIVEDLTKERIEKQTQAQLQREKYDTFCASDFDFSDSDSDESPPQQTKGFRFGGNRSDGENELSSDISDTESIMESTPPPLPPSRTRLRVLTPKSSGWIGRKRRRLNWGGSQEASQRQSGGFSLDESELDSISFTCSQSPGVLNNSNFQDAKALQENQFLRTISMEVHCTARGSLIPDPSIDAIQAIFYFIHDETLTIDNSGQKNKFGCFMVNVASTSKTDSDEDPGSLKTFADELSMIHQFIRLVHEADPDILVGYEICRFSWGYLIDRGRQLGLDLTSDLSRLLPFPNSSRHPRSQEQWNESISGRIVLNLWRLLRHEMTVTSYTFENAVFQILHERVHLLSYRVLADQWERLNKKFKVVTYFKRRVVDVIRIIEKLDLINRTSELARLFGIQFFEVLSRGSQFRVESMMLRLAKSYNLIPPSPSPPQRASMKAPEYLPLIMEPESKFYQDPVAVLDFHSLYPSMMIAYNYCFSTCIGRVIHIGEESSFQLGCLSQSVSLEEVQLLMLQGLLHISPCGVIFVKESVKKGILGEMLEQILDTRQMVKRAMKKWKKNPTLHKVLDSRQLGLKLIANVTYGYTSANFSGRMPCVEIADSVVSKGRETLQRTIDFVKANEDRFRAKVVYGDTDSLFVHFPGMTRAEAFRLSQEIVDEVTAANPKPVKLKLEKVYQPCILQTKKRYVGYAYETPDQSEPTYDAKGIETVRRDGCPATAQILKGALNVLFVTQDERQVKSFVQEQFRKIFIGRVSLSKYTFAREYRGRSGYKPTAVVPSLEIAKRVAEKDPRAEPLPSQRVPYIVVYGDPNLPLIQLIRRPEDFIGNHNLRLNAHYYIEKAIIPPLSRCFTLAKMDVSKWYDEMPRKYLKSHYAGDGGGKKGTIDQYFVSETCIKCESRSQTGFCEQCFESVEEVKDFLNNEEIRLTKKFEKCCTICIECSEEKPGICINMDCPIKHRFLRYDCDYTTRRPKLLSLSEKVSIAMSSW